jgi:uncharacterized protein YndB with AHSA1/START domain
MLRIILAALPITIVVFLIVVALQPSEYRVARSATISAPPAAVFAQVNDFHKWETWNPWGKMDPTMRQTFEGAPSGTGGVYSWSGNKEVGEGRMTITESRPNELIRIRLDFFKPFAATSIAEFTFKPEGNHTAVTWSMERRQDLHGQGHPFVYEHGQHDRQPVRKGSGGHESCGGSNGEGITEK